MGAILVETLQLISAITGNKLGHFTISSYIFKLKTLSNVFVDVCFEKVSVSNAYATIMKNTHVFHMWFTRGIGTITCDSHMIHT
jgi:hypothetical protein